MSQLTFKTNIKCGGCIATVKPHLDNFDGIKNWSVDTSTPDKLLTVEADEVSVDEICKTIESAGYKIEFLNKQ
jgi:copper chaperone CopZ